MLNDPVFIEEEWDHWINFTELSATLTLFWTFIYTPHPLHTHTLFSDYHFHKCDRDVGFKCIRLTVQEEAYGWVWVKEEEVSTAHPARRFCFWSHVLFCPLIRCRDDSTRRQQRLPNWKKVTPPWPLIPLSSVNGRIPKSCALKRSREAANNNSGA